MRIHSFPIRETGLLLFVKNYEKCVNFYSQKLGLKVRFRKPYLTTFNFGGGYLLIERGRRKNVLKDGVIRLNVRDVPRAIEAFQKKGVKIQFHSYEWGDIGQFKDPDGNILQLCKWK